MELVLGVKKNTIFEIAKQKLQAIKENIQSEVIPMNLEKNKWFKVLPNEAKSPLIMKISEDSHLIYYPANSVPYTHAIESKCKFVDILSGQVFDELSGKRYITGQRFKIFPGDQLRPYTGDSEAYVKVCIADCKNLIESICD